MGPISLPFYPYAPTAPQNLVHVQTRRQWQTLLIGTQATGTPKHSAKHPKELHPEELHPEELHPEELLLHLPSTGAG